MFPEAELYKVTLRDVDPELMIAVDDHMRAVVERFHAIMQHHEEGRTSDIQERVVTLMHTLETTYTLVIARLGAREAAEEAIVYGRPSCTVELELPRGAVFAGDAFIDMMAEADEYCRSTEGLGDLVSRPEVVVYRKWLMNEITRQLLEQLAQP